MEREGRLMRRMIKAVALIYLGVQLEHRARKLLLKHGFVKVDQHGNTRKADDWDERIDAIINRIIPTKSSDGRY
jgi:hypothetical protein